MHCPAPWVCRFVGSNHSSNVEFELIVDRALHGVRIDSFLVKHFRNYTSWKMQRIVRAGGATIDHAPASETDRVFRGQTVRVQLLEPPDKLLLPDDISLPVVYEDPWMMVVCKPAGLTAHPTGEIQHRTLANAIQQHLDTNSPSRGLMRAGIVHRLDRQTSGLMAVALTHSAHTRLSLSFEQSRVSKTYVALVDGVAANDSGVISVPIGGSPTGRHVLMSCRADAIDRKPARTHYRVLRRYSNHTLISATPLTGRNHQIRVHLAHLGHPLVGDEFYESHGRYKPLDEELDSGEVPREVDTGLPMRRHALHAEHLEFAHPITGIWMSFSCGLPDDFVATLQKLSNRSARRQTCAAVD